MMCVRQKQDETSAMIRQQVKLMKVQRVLSLTCLETCPQQMASPLPRNIKLPHSSLATHYYLVLGRRWWRRRFHAHARTQSRLFCTQIASMRSRRSLISELIFCAFIAARLQQKSHVLLLSQDKLILTPDFIWDPV
jgi:hypothetical protein